MIRLIVSDVDGTLLQPGERAINRKCLNMIEDLCDKGIIFAVASGREYSNLYRIFGKVQDRIMYICLNGALIIYKGKVLCRTPIDKKMGLEIIEDIQSKKKCEVLLSGVNTCYIKGTHRDYVDHIVNFLQNETQIIRSFDDVEDDFLKISVYARDGIGEFSDYFISKWGLQLPTVISGEKWLDFNGPFVNKGNALMVVQKLFDIREDETMTFGDNYNDIEMFEKSYFSYAMSNASSEIRAKARYLTPTVESILFDVLRMR